MLVKVINDELPNILQHLIEEFIKDPLLNEVVDIQKVTSSIENQRALLESIFSTYLKQEAFEEGKEELENICLSFYKDVDIPFAVIYKTLTNLKLRVIAHVINTLEIKNNDEILEIEHFIENLINLVSKVYIKKDIYKLSHVYPSKFEEYLLFRSHVAWIKNIVDAIKEDKMENFPLGDEKDCEFSNYLDYPESLMICMDANLCVVLHDLHRTLHKNTNTLYLFYTQGQYYQAYMALQNFIGHVTSFKKVVTELYFLAYNNLEENFYKLIELLLYQKTPLFLTIIDFHKVRSLNATYGQTTVNKLLHHIDTQIQEQVHYHEKNTLLIKGTTANYYMLSVDVSADKIERLNQQLYTLTNNTFEFNNKEIELQTTIVTLSLNGFVEKKRDDLTKMMLHLKAKHKHDDHSSYIHLPTEIQELNQWLDASYKDMNYLSQKLQKKEIDVVFQPLYDVQTGKIKVIEALARIKEKNKLISAGVFIDTLYEMDKVEVLDQIVLERLIEKKEFIVQVASTLFVNVSYKSLFDKKYRDSFNKFLKVFKGYSVIFELTEQRLVENIDTIQELHKLYGIKFAVDDFGTGYSSLKTVADLSDKNILQVLKMDGEIVQTIDSKKSTTKIMQVISTLSKELNLCSVAEYVETQDVLDRLKEMDVTYAQGYLLSKPHTIEELLVKKLNDTLNYNK